MYYLELYCLIFKIWGIFLSILYYWFLIKLCCGQRINTVSFQNSEISWGLLKEQLLGMYILHFAIIGYNILQMLSQRNFNIFNYDCGICLFLLFCQFLFLFLLRFHCSFYYYSSICVFFQSPLCYLCPVCPIISPFSSVFSAFVCIYGMVLTIWF